MMDHSSHDESIPSFGTTGRSKEAGSREEAANASEVPLTRSTATDIPLPALSGHPGNAPGLPSVPGYSILSELGRGGMGVVYKALELRLSRLIALKMIRSGSLAGQSELARMRKEADALARLRHPNVVQIYQVGEHESRPYLALEFCEGGSLADRLRRTPLPPRQAAQLLELLARAVHAAHECGILHRDLKPPNVLLAKDGVPKLTDFGLAKRLDGEQDGSVPGVHTPSGVVLGTPGYMAPEQAQGKAREATPAIDIYGLGAILYELLTGRPPFIGETVAEAMMLVLTTAPVPPRSLDPKVPRDLETICLKCLEKEPRKRYASALELAEELARFLRGEPIRARPLSRPARLWRWCLRKPAVAAAGGLALFAALTIVVFSLLFAFREHQAADKIGQEQANTAAALKQSQELAATLALDRGLALCEQGEVGRGMLWLVRSLELVPDNATELQRVIRIDLGGRRSQLRAQRHQFRGGDLAWRVGFHPDGKLVLTAFLDGSVQLWNAATGEPHGQVMKHGKEVESFAFSPDGKLLATASRDLTVRLWDTATCKQVSEPLRHPEPVSALTFSPDNKTLLTACDDGVCRFWEVPTGKAMGNPLQHGGKVTAVAYRPDGKTILTASADKTARQWDPANGQPIAEVMNHTSAVDEAAFSPDGRMIVAVCDDYTVHRWDAATGKPLGEPLRHLGMNLTTRNKTRVSLALAVSPDSKKILTGGDDGMARVWDEANGQLLFDPLQHPDWVAYVAFSPDGASVLTGCGDGMVRMWDATTGQPLGPPIPHGGGVKQALFSPDGSTILVGGYERTARLWETSLPRVAGPPLHHDNAVMAVAFRGDGQLVATAGKDPVIRLWDVETSKEFGERLSVSGPIRDLAFSPDGRILVAGGHDGTLYFWDIATRKRLFDGPARHQKLIWSIAFSPDGKSVLSGSHDGTALLWDMATGQPRSPVLKHRGPVDTVAYSPDSRLVATGSYDHSARLWDAQTGELLASFRHDDWVWAVAFSPDGALLATASSDGTARLWDVASKLPHGPPLTHENRVQSLAFSPKGDLLLTGSEDRTARLWHVATGHPASPPLTHPGAGLFSVAFSPEGTCVLTGCHDGTARLWDVATGKPLGPPLRHAKDVQRVAFSPDGRRVVTASMDGTARLWEVPSEWLGDVSTLKDHVQASSGLELMDDGSFRWLHALRWPE
jgi:WD40 repeat protein